MSEKKKNQHEEEHDEQEDQEENPASHSGDLLDYDPERAQDMIDLKEVTGRANQVSAPNPDDPQRPGQGVPPGQENVPRGGTTGSGMQGGSAKRRKR